MQKVHALKAAALGAMTAVLFALPAYAQTVTTIDTPGEVTAEATDKVGEFVPYIIGALLAVFALTLLVVLAKKVIGMGKNAIRAA